MKARLDVMRMLLFPALLCAGLITPVTPDALAQQGTSPSRRRPVPRVAPDMTDPTTWIRTYATPLDRVSGTGVYSDLLPLERELASAGIIGLGDNSHGTREFYQVKLRLIEYLVRELGFTAIAFEAPWVEFNLIDDLVQGERHDDPRALLTNRDYWFWNTEEIAEVVAWVRDYNAARGDQPAVQIAGIDVFTSDAVEADVIAFLDSVDPAAAGTARTAYACLAPSTSASCVSGVNAVATALAANRELYVSRSSLRRYEQVLQSARVAHQTGVYAMVAPRERPEVRDGFMADNVARLREVGHQKVIYWAHNLHVSKAPYTFPPATERYRSAGTVLSERYDDYYVIGTMTRRGQFVGIVNSTKPPSFRVVAVPELSASSYEAMFDDAGFPAMFIPLQDAPDTVAAARPLLVMYASPAWAFLTDRRISELYDAVLYIEETRESTLLR